MKSERERVIELLQTRLERLRLLGRDLIECRQSFVQLDLAGMHDHIQLQERLCLEIRSLDAELSRVVAALGAEMKMPRQLNPYDALPDVFRSDGGERLTPLLVTMAATQADVRQLNRVQGEMLVRSRRWLNALANMMPSVAGTYQPPRRQPPLSIELGI